MRITSPEILNAFVGTTHALNYKTFNDFINSSSQFPGHANNPYVHNKASTKNIGTFASKKIYRNFNN